ncbi:DUF2974 domain-containing protein [Pseudomonas sp. CVAP|uniref:lipase family protein n=1 Tax=Pseudomonas sp. CVAP\|nr:DUF2974 domain-containing protein [Pseudomonas sp. CVAP\
MQDILVLKGWRALLMSLLLVGCTAFNQGPEEVTVREPGHRLLGNPVPNRAEAVKHWQYAWLSDAAYARAVDGASKEICTGTDADQVLEKHDWKRWKDFPIPGGHLDSMMRNSHLRTEVWENRKLQEIVVAFGGTEAKSGKDWLSNFRWFTFKFDDEYTVLVKQLAPAFVEEVSRRMKGDDYKWLNEARFISVGHSLGGGLAQQFAYALPGSSVNLKVTQVYAFDPSPVTGFFSVDKTTRDANKAGLFIDRIYERGEGLAILRSFTSVFVRPSDINPTIRGVRYSLIQKGNAISNHSIHNFACRVQKAAGMETGEVRL